MTEKELRRTLAIFPIGSVMKLTDLTARQIRYYEEQGLILPERTEGNRRLYSLNDMDRLLEIRDFLLEGLTIAAIKKRYQNELMPSQKSRQQLPEERVRQVLHDDFLKQSGFALPNDNLTGSRLG